MKETPLSNIDNDPEVPWATNKTSINPEKRLQENNNIRTQERCDDIRTQLMWKSFSSGEISLLYPDKDMKKSPMKFNLSEQTIQYGGSTIQISLPAWASISKVVFDEKWIILEGKLGFLSGKGDASYEWFVKAINTVLKEKKATIASKSGNIDMKVV